MTEERIFLLNGRRLHIECGIEVNIPDAKRKSTTTVIKQIRQFKYDGGEEAKKITR